MAAFRVEKHKDWYAVVDKNGNIRYEGTKEDCDLYVSGAQNSKVYESKQDKCNRGKEKYGSKENAYSADTLLTMYAREKGGVGRLLDNPDLLTPSTIRDWLRDKNITGTTANSIIEAWKDSMQPK